MPPYDEKIRDTTRRSTIGHEGLNDNVVGKIFLETVRTFFLSADNFATERMRERTPPLLWSENIDETAVRIIDAKHWHPQDMGRTPEIVIRSGGTKWYQMNMGALIDAPTVTREDPDYVADMIVGRVVVWVVSSLPDEAEMISWELATFFSAFSRPLIQEYGFSNIRPAGVSPPVHVAERKTYWGCAVNIAISWQNVQELIEQQPTLAEVTPNIEGVP